MAKFNLVMKDGVAVRKMSELREHFDLKEAVKYLGNGRLVTWLRDRGYDEEADKLDVLVDECNGNHEELVKGLCAALGIEFDATKIEAKELEGISELSRKAERLGQFTDDKALLATADRAAFDQADLDRLAKDDNPDIYLVDGRFTIPLEVMHKHYVGVGSAVAVIRSEEFVDFDALDIIFKNVTLNEECGKAYWGEKYNRDGDIAYNEKDYEKARDYYQKSADTGHAGGMGNLGIMYKEGLGTSQNHNEALKWFQKGAKAGGALAMNQLGWAYAHGEVVSQNMKIAAEWFRKGAEAGSTAAMNNLGWLYKHGEGVKQDSKEAVKWFRKAAAAGNASGMYNLGLAYDEGMGVEQNEDEAMKWYHKAVELGSGEAAWNISVMYNQKGDSGKAEKWRKKAKELGYEKEDSSGCFITTAVCGNFSKPDDCYELTMFREFRDFWLLRQPDGEALIHEYYKTAPSIVTAIDCLDEAKEVYRTIWERYLFPCLHHLEKREYAECKELYVKMVRDLQKRFLENN